MKRRLVNGDVWNQIDTSAGPSGCWPWQLSTASHGYGRVLLNGRTWAVHVLAYESRVGPVPTGLELDHLCGNKACCNPAHLEPVTHRVNILRADTPATVNAAKTHCPQGHEYTPENTWRVKDGFRRCKICQHQYHLESQRRARRRRNPDHFQPDGTFVPRRFTKAITAEAEKGIEGS
jgi:hypothetical protein